MSSFTWIDELTAAQWHVRGPESNFLSLTRGELAERSHCPAAQVLSQLRQWAEIPAERVYNLAWGEGHALDGLVIIAKNAPLPALLKGV